MRLSGYALGAFWLGRLARVCWDASEWCDARATQRQAATSPGQSPVSAGPEDDEEDPLPEVPLLEDVPAVLPGSLADRLARARRG